MRAHYTFLSRYYECVMFTCTLSFYELRGLSFVICPGSLTASNNMMQPESPRFEIESIDVSVESDPLDISFGARGWVHPLPEGYRNKEARWGLRELESLLDEAPPLALTKRVARGGHFGWANAPSPRGAAGQRGPRYVGQRCMAPALRCGQIEVHEPVDPRSLYRSLEVWPATGADAGTPYWRNGTSANHSAQAEANPLARVLGEMGHQRWRPVAGPLVEAPTISRNPYVENGWKSQLRRGSE